MLDYSPELASKSAAEARAEQEIAWQSLITTLETHPVYTRAIVLGITKYETGSDREDVKKTIAIFDAAPYEVKSIMLVLAACSLGEVTAREQETQENIATGKTLDSPLASNWRYCVSDMISGKPEDRVARQIYEQFLSLTECKSGIEICEKFAILMTKLNKEGLNKLGAVFLAITATIVAVRNQLIREREQQQNENRERTDADGTGEASQPNPGT